MKSLAFFSLFILPITTALSQGSFYPLGTGDYWVYWEYGQYGGVWDTIRVVTEGDTTLGGKVYKVHNHISSRYRYDSPLLTFERVDSSGDVFIFDAIVGGESLLYRLSDTSNSWWMSNGFLHRFDSCVVKDMFGQPRKALYVGSYDAADTTLRTQVLLIDSIGYYTTILYGIVDGTAPPVLHRGTNQRRGLRKIGRGQRHSTRAFPLECR